VGRTFTNLFSGERMEIISSTPDLLVFELFLPPGKSVPARHVHPQQEERFTVLEGELRFSIGRHTLSARTGDTVTVNRGAAHWFGNRGAIPAKVRVEVQPALRMEELLETTQSLGRTKIADLARLLLDFHQERAVPFVPQRLVTTLLAPFRRR
jgi:quercetin dioxygenase-like cupin family protein